MSKFEQFRLPPEATNKLRRTIAKGNDAVLACRSGTHFYLSGIFVDGAPQIFGLTPEMIFPGNDDSLSGILYSDDQVKLSQGTRILLEKVLDDLE